MKTFGLSQVAKKKRLYWLHLANEQESNLVVTMVIDTDL
jgi:hypothetical protein